jgi:hypothetical protein
MRTRRRLLSFQDAVALLTGDTAGLAAADRAVGGALAIATGGASDAVLGALGVRDRILRTGRDLTGNLRERLAGTGRARRSELVAAAHTVVVIAAASEILGELPLPAPLADLELTERGQMAAAGGDSSASDALLRLLTVPAPLPSAELPPEHIRDELLTWYREFGARLQMHFRGLARWQALGSSERHEGMRQLVTVLPADAVDRYGELYARLALEVPEFGFWNGQTEHRATRGELRRSLSGIEEALVGLTAPAALTHAAEGLAVRYRAALERPILAEGQTPAGMRVPTLGDGYVDHEFRVQPVGEGGNPADEDRWAVLPVRADLTGFLAGLLTGPAAAAPLVVLGQPGAGKSVLTRILAARLPAAGYLPVRIVLRDVPADLDIQDQIEYAVRAETGERVSWPELVRAAPGTVPVLMFDGFDELLQATGTSQSDFLIRVARFQEREADQGRPVFALVTSRTAVADRARCPDGTVALRLEPFSGPQIERWLEVWGGLNRAPLAARGLTPLPAAVAVRYGQLASQPLLLLMLALHDGTGNALQRAGDGEHRLDEGELYEELLTSFALREVRRTAPGTDRELADRAGQELQRLSLISFAMLNRRRQWITADEADHDLTAVLGARPADGDGFRAPLGRGEIALGRFFFVQRSQALREERRLVTYEFLHSTFGEYLIARLTVQLLEGLLTQRPALSVGRARTDDDLLYVLLSYGSLASRQHLRFAADRIARLPAADRERLGDLLLTAMADHRNRTEHRYSDYRPGLRATTSRHALYSANLLLLTVLVTGGVSASRLFPEAAKPAAIWHRRVMLWRAAFRETEWTDFAVALDLRQTWRGEVPDLELLPGGFGLPTEPPDGLWLYGWRSDPGTPVLFGGRTRPAELRHKLLVSGGSGDGTVLHAIDPFVEHLPQALTTFHRFSAEDPAASVAQLLTEVVLTGAQRDDERLHHAYRRCHELLLTLDGRPPDDLPGHARVALLVYRQLLLDLPRVPTEQISALLDATTRWHGETLDRMRARVALNAFQWHGGPPFERFTERLLLRLGTVRPDELSALLRDPLPERAAELLASAVAALPADRRGAPADPAEPAAPAEPQPRAGGSAAPAPAAPVRPGPARDGGAAPPEPAPR